MVWCHEHNLQILLLQHKQEGYESLCESGFLQRDHGDLGWWRWCCWCWGGLNIRNRLAASSLGTKIHAGEKLARRSCRNAKTRSRHLPSLCVTSASVLFTVPARPVPTHPHTPTTDLGTVRGGVYGRGAAWETHSWMQIPNHSFKWKHYGRGWRSQISSVATHSSKETGHMCTHRLHPPTPHPILLLPL